MVSTRRSTRVKKVDLAPAAPETVIHRPLSVDEIRHLLESKAAPFDFKWLDVISSAFTMGDLARAENACIVYAKLCVVHPLGIRDSVTETQFEWLKRNLSLLSLRSQQQLLTEILSQIESVVLSDLALARLFLAITPVIGRSHALILGLCKRHREQTLDWLISSEKHLDSNLLLSVIERIGVRDSAAFLVRWMSVPSISSIVESVVKRDLHSIEHAVSAIFFVQVVTYHGIKSSMPSLLQVVLEALSRLVSCIPAAPVSLTPIVADRGQLICCDSCPSSKVNRNLPAHALERMGFFECGNCHNIFSCECDQCGSSVLRVESARLCWSCSYRFMASEFSGDVEMMSSMDSEMVSWLLVLSCMDESAAVEFVSEYIPSIPKPKISSSAESSGVTVSRDFAYQLLLGLFLRDRATRITTMIVRSLIVSSPSVPAIKALCCIVTAHEFSCLAQAIVDYAVGALYTSTCTKTVNACVSLLSSVDDESVLPTSTVIETVASMNMFGLSSKRLIITKLVDSRIEQPGVLDALLQYMSLDERWDFQALFEVFMDKLNRSWHNEIKHVCELVEHSLVLRPLLCRLIDPCMITRDNYCGYVLKECRWNDQLMTLIPALIQDEEWSGLASLLLRSDQPVILASQVRSIVTDHVVPCLVSGSSSSVRSASQLLAAFAEKSLIDRSYIEQVIGRFKSDLAHPQKQLRSAWILSTLIQTLGPYESIAEEIVNYSVSNPAGLFGPVCFVACNEQLRERIISMPAFQSLISNSLKSDDTNLRLRALDTLNSIMTAALSQSTPTRHSARPDGGVKCRSLSQFYSPIVADDFLFCSNKIALVAKSLECLARMDQLGIVNRRSLPPLYFNRYVLPILSGDTTDVNMYAWQLYKEVRDSSTSVYGNFFTEFKRLCVPSADAIVNSAYRLVEGVFSSESKKEECRKLTSLALNELVACQSNDLIPFYIAVVASGAAHVAEERASVIDTVKSRPELADFVRDFVLAEVTTAKVQRDRLSLVDDIVQRFHAGQAGPVVEEFVQIRKRPRTAQRGAPPKTKKRKVETISDSEYTDGGSDSEDAN